MCKISRETVIRANERTMCRPIHKLHTSNVSNDEIIVSTQFGGMLYSHKVSVHELNESYNRSLKMSLKR